MAESRQFGSPKMLQFGDKSAAGKAGDTGHCGQCEAMLADALDGTLTAEEQAIFDLHTAECGPCAQSLADARRGVAWLEMLRDPRPEPPAELMERILAQTSGTAAGAVVGGVREMPLPGAALSPVPVYAGVPAAAYGYAGQARAGNVLPFRGRIAAAVRASAIGQIMLQPRLAMTAAMAFLSIALTLDLTGVRVQDLRASDLRPANLERDYYSANARVVQYYEGLRVVYELESRVHDLQNGPDADTPAETQSAPVASPVQPVGQPAPGSPALPAKPAPKQGPGAARPAPNSGTSRREDMSARTARRLA